MGSLKKIFTATLASVLILLFFGIMPIYAVEDSAFEHPDTYQITLERKFSAPELQKYTFSIKKGEKIGTHLPHDFVRTYYPGNLRGRFDIRETSYEVEGKVLSYDEVCALVPDQDMVLKGKGYERHVVIYANFYDGSDPQDRLEWNPIPREVKTRDKVYKTIEFKEIKNETWRVEGRQIVYREFKADFIVPHNDENGKIIYYDPIEYPMSEDDWYKRWQENTDFQSTYLEVEDSGYRPMLRYTKSSPFFYGAVSDASEAEPKEVSIQFRSRGDRWDFPEKDTTDSREIRKEKHSYTFTNDGTDGAHVQFFNVRGNNSPTVVFKEKIQKNMGEHSDALEHDFNFPSTAEGLVGTNFFEFDPVETDEYKPFFLNHTTSSDPTKVNGGYKDPVVIYWFYKIPTTFDLGEGTVSDPQFPGAFDEGHKVKTYVLHNFKWQQSKKTPEVRAPEGKIFVGWKRAGHIIEVNDENKITIPLIKGKEPLIFEAVYRDQTGAEKKLAQGKNLILEQGASQPEALDFIANPKDLPKDTKVHFKEGIIVDTSKLVEKQKIILVVEYPDQSKQELEVEYSVVPPKPDPSSVEIGAEANDLDANFYEPLFSENQTHRSVWDPLSSSKVNSPNKSRVLKDDFLDQVPVTGEKKTDSYLYAVILATFFAVLLKAVRKKQLK